MRLEILAATILAGAVARPCLAQSAESLAAGGQLSLTVAMGSAQVMASRIQDQNKLNDGLYEAAIRGDERAVASFIQQGADVNAVYAPNVGNRPLDAAAIFGVNAVAVTWTLMRAGADINLQDWSGMTPLAYDAMYGRKDVVSMVLDRFSSRVTAATANGALTVAAEFGKTDIVSEMLAAGINPNARRLDNPFENRATALMLSVKSGSSALGAVKALLSVRGIRVDDADSQGWTALMYAAQYKNVKAERLLLLAGAKRDLKNHVGQTANDIALDVARKQAAYDAWCRANPGPCED